MGNDEVLKKLKKSTSQVDEFIAEMEKNIALNKEHIANNRSLIAKNKEKIAGIAYRHQAIAKYANESLARMRQETRAIQEEMEIQDAVNTATMARLEMDKDRCKKH